MVQVRAATAAGRSQQLAGRRRWAEDGQQTPVSSQQCPESRLSPVFSAEQIFQITRKMSGGGGGRITETIFSLRRIGFSANSSSDGAEILENEDSEQQSGDQGKKSSCRELGSLKKSTLYSVFIILTVMGTLVATLCLYIQTEQNLKENSIRIMSLEQLLKQRDDDNSISNLRSSVRLLQHGFNMAKDTSKMFALNVTQQLQMMKHSSALVMKNLLRESNLTLCSEQERRISVPVAATYKVTINLLVKGDLQSGEEVATVTAGDTTLDGGSIKVRDIETDPDWRVACTGAGEGSAASCSQVDHAMVAKLGDNEEVRLVPGHRHLQDIVDVRICLKLTNIKLPKGVTSTSVSH